MKKSTSSPPLAQQDDRAQEIRGAVLGTLLSNPGEWYDLEEEDLLAFGLAVTVVVSEIEGALEGALDSPQRDASRFEAQLWEGNVQVRRQTALAAGI